MRIARGKMGGEVDGVRVRRDLGVVSKISGRLVRCWDSGNGLVAEEV